MSDVFSLNPGNLAYSTILTEELNSTCTYQGTNLGYKERKIRGSRFLVRVKIYLRHILTMVLMVIIFLSGNQYSGTATLVRRAYITKAVESGLPSVIKVGNDGVPFKRKSGKTLSLQAAGLEKVVRF